MEQRTLRRNHDGYLTVVDEQAAIQILSAGGWSDVTPIKNMSMRNPDAARWMQNTEDGRVVPYVGRVVQEAPALWREVSEEFKNQYGERIKEILAAKREGRVPPPMLSAHVTPAIQQITPQYVPETAPAIPQPVTPIDTQDFFGSVDTGPEPVPITQLVNANGLPNFDAMDINTLYNFAVDMGIVLEPDAPRSAIVAEIMKRG